MADAQFDEADPANRRVDIEELRRQLGGIGPQPNRPAVPDGPPDLRHAGKIEPFVALAVDPNNNAAFMMAGNNFLKHYSYPDFKYRGSYKIGGVPYRAAQDVRNGLLCVAIAGPKTEPANEPFERPRHVGDLHLYDLKPILEGKLLAGSELVPVAKLPMEASFSHLLVSPDGNWLYYLDVKSNTNVLAGRIDLGKRQKAGELRLEDRTETMCLTRDGKTLYTTVLLCGHSPYHTEDKTRGKIQRIETAAMKLQDTVEVKADPYSVAARDDGIVFISSGSCQWTNIYTVDMLNRRGIIATSFGVRQCAQVLIAPDEKRLYNTDLGSLHSRILPQNFATAQRRTAAPSKRTPTRRASGESQ